MFGLIQKMINPFVWLHKGVLPLFWIVLGGTSAVYAFEEGAYWLAVLSLAVVVCVPTTNLIVAVILFRQRKQLGEIRKRNEAQWAALFTCPNCSALYPVDPEYEGVHCPYCHKDVSTDETIPRIGV